MKDIVESKIMGLFKSIKDLTAYRHYYKYYGDLLKNLGVKDEKVEGEDEYLAKWSALYKKVDRHSYRLFSKFVGNNPNIVPENVAMRYVEANLNPIKYRKYYEDKNMYGKYIRKELMPETILRRIDGGSILDDEYNLLCIRALTEMGGGNLILKPSVDSNSGRGVMLFKENDGIYKSSDGKSILNTEFLMNYGNDFILQKAVIQSKEMSRFCMTSLNTIRLNVYKSIENDEPHVLACILRIGKDGSYVDNAHAGGKFVAVNPKNGKLGTSVLDQFANTCDEWNGINFKESEFYIPNWEKVVELAKEVSLSNPHMRMIAMDIAIDENGNPVFIEGNVTGNSYWLFMLAGQLPFGEYTDEIIDYCAKHKERVKFNALKLI